jgi:hypothetical protein
VAPPGEAKQKHRSTELAPGAVDEASPAGGEYLDDSAFENGHAGLADKIAADRAGWVVHSRPRRRLKPHTQRYRACTLATP